MTTAVDAGLEALLMGEAPPYRHAICGFCHPDTSALRAEVMTLCGERMPSAEWLARRATGAPKCATCVVIPLGNWPCGH